MARIPLGYTIRRDDWTAQIAAATTSFMGSLMAISAGLGTPYSPASSWTDAPDEPTSRARGLALEEYGDTSSQMTPAIRLSINKARLAWEATVDAQVGEAYVVSGAPSPARDVAALQAFLDELRGYAVTYSYAPGLSWGLLVPDPSNPSGPPILDTLICTGPDALARAAAIGALASPDDANQIAFALRLVIPANVAVATAAVGDPPNDNELVFLHGAEVEGVVIASLESFEPS